MKTVLVVVGREQWFDNCYQRIGSILIDENIVILFIYLSITIQL